MQLDSLMILTHLLTMPSMFHEFAWKKFNKAVYKCGEINRSQMAPVMP